MNEENKNDNLIPSPFFERKEKKSRDEQLREMIKTPTIVVQLLKVNERQNNIQMDAFHLPKEEAEKIIKILAQSFIDRDANKT